MTGGVVPAVVPGRSTPATQRLRQTSTALPLAPIARSAKLPSWTYAVAHLDRSGRIASGSTYETLGWRAGDPITITSRSHEAIVAVPDEHGAFTLTKRGHLPVPARIRTRCGLRAGDCVLLAAHPGRGVLIAYTITALEEILRSSHDAHLAEPAS